MRNADVAVEAPADVAVGEAEASVIADAQAVITDSASTPPAESSDLADENYFYEKYYQGRYSDEANTADGEAEYEYYTGYGHDEYWTASEDADTEPVQSEPQAQCEADAPAECGLANDEYEPACSESYRSAYGYEYDSALDVAETSEEASLPAETAVVETAEDSGYRVRVPVRRYRVLERVRTGRDRSDHR